MSSGPWISLEDHFVSSVCESDDVAETLALHQFPPTILSRLKDVAETRTQVMDESGISVQVVSHIPVPLSLEECVTTNNDLAKAIRNGASRFRGFATLPVAEPEKIVKEFERCIKDLGFVGALIPNHAFGTYYDGPQYLPMWQTAQSLDVPVYLHPTPPAESAVPPFRGNYSEDVSFALSTHAWDWHANCGLHFIRLYSAGLFDRLQNLKIILGHLGELLPFMLDRAQRKLALTKDSKAWRISLKEAYDRHIWITTSGMFDTEPFKLALNVTKGDRIMFSVDYPFESTVDSTEFIDNARQAKVISEEQYAAIAYRNAADLLRIKLNA